MENISEKEYRVIRKQLGKEPKGLVGVPARCSYGYPVVLMNKPLIIGKDDQFEIFPTLYWLSCPRRVEKVAGIESEGYIEVLEEELASSPRLIDEYKENEERYLEKQRSLLSEKEKDFIADRGLEGALSRGIGGIESDRHIKCLHLHVAHQIAEANVLGKIVQARFEIGDCPRGEVRCEEFSEEETI